MKSKQPKEFPKNRIRTSLLNAALMAESHLNFHEAVVDFDNFSKLEIKAFYEALVSIGKLIRSLEENNGKDPCK